MRKGAGWCAAADDGGGVGCLLAQLFQGKPDESFLKSGWTTDAQFADPLCETKVSARPGPVAIETIHLPRPPIC